MDGLAIYAALLSTLLAIVQIISFVRELRREKRQVKVFGELVVSKERAEFTRFEVDWAVVSVVNIGHRLVTIVAMGFAMDGEGFIVRTRANSNLGSMQPKELSDGQMTAQAFWGDEIEMNFQSFTPDELVKVQAYARDAEGNEYFSKIPDTWVQRIQEQKVKQVEKKEET